MADKAEKKTAVPAEEKAPKATAKKTRSPDWKSDLWGR